MQSSSDGALARDTLAAGSPPPPAPERPKGHGDADALRSSRLFFALVALYALVIALLYAFGLFGFFFKTVIVPSLFVVAYLARRFASFVRDWSVFLAVTVLFDNVRGLIYGALLRFQLPVYMDYAIAAEAQLFGTPIPNVWLQSWLFQARAIGAFEQFFVLVHASHFLLFLLVGLRIWLTRARELVRFCWAMSLVMYGALVSYLLVPTVPPWMASSRFHVLPEITQMPRQVYNLAVPTATQAFDVNPVAAMPSLHAAFPAMLALVCARHFGRASWPVSLYALLAWFGVVYMGEHYIVDVLAGVALAAGAYLLCYRCGPLARCLGARGERALTAPARHELRRPLLLGALLLAVAQGASALGASLATRDIPTEDFIARELDGKSPMASYYRGLRAFYAGDCATVERMMARAEDEVPDPAKRARSVVLRGECAYKRGDFTSAARRLRHGTRSSEQALMLADAELRLGRREAGLQELARITRGKGVPPEVQAAAARIAEFHGLR
jgi:membrane-associated phospholipid phosphatase